MKKTTTYHDLVNELIEMPRIRDALDPDSIPAPSTLCNAFDRLEMAVWRVLLNVSLADLPLNGVIGIDASRFERAHASTHYTKRTNLSVQQLKTTLLVDTATNAVLDIHVTTTRKHDTQIAPQVVKRNAASIAVLTGDKGYDNPKIRRLAQNHDIRPLIKHREFTPLHKAWNARLDSDLYHRRNMNETVNAAIKQKFRAFVRSRLWWKQFREQLVEKAEKAVSALESKGEIEIAESAEVEVRVYLACPECETRVPLETPRRRGYVCADHPTPSPRITVPDQVSLPRVSDPVVEAVARFYL